MNFPLYKWYHEIQLIEFNKPPFLNVIFHFLSISLEIKKCLKITLGMMTHELHHE